MIKEELINNYFSEKELKCKCNRNECDATEFSDKLLDIMNSIRKEYGKPILVTSARRCKYHNSNIGGSPNSKHLTGDAIDIMLDINDLVPFLSLVSDTSIRGIGIGKGWIHLDVRKGKYKSWFY